MPVPSGQDDRFQLVQSSTRRFGTRLKSPRFLEINSASQERAIAAIRISIVPMRIR